MNEAKSPAPTPVIVAMEPTWMVDDPLLADDDVDVVDEVELGVAVLLEHATSVVTQATAATQRSTRLAGRLLSPLSPRRLVTASLAIGMSDRRPSIGSPFAGVAGHETTPTMQLSIRACTLPPSRR